MNRSKKGNRGYYVNRRNYRSAMRGFWRWWRGEVPEQVGTLCPQAKWYLGEHVRRLSARNVY